MNYKTKTPDTHWLIHSDVNITTELLQWHCLTLASLQVHQTVMQECQCLTMSLILSTNIHNEIDSILNYQLLQINPYRLLYYSSCLININIRISTSPKACDILRNVKPENVLNRQRGRDIEIIIS